MREARVAHGGLLLAPQQPDVSRDEQRHEQRAARASRARGRSCAAPPRWLRQAAAGGELAAPLAQVGEAQDRVDEVVVGRELERVDAGVAERRAQRRPRAARRPRRSACGSRGRACRRTAARRSRRPGSTSSPRSGSSISSGSYRRTATTSWRCARCASGLRPARRADEVGDDEHERAARASTCSAALQELAEVGRRATARRSGRVSMRCRMCSTWRRPLRAGITVSTSSP